MSRLILNKGAAPSSPAAGKQSFFSDSADNKPKMKDENALVYSLIDDGLRSTNILFNGGMWFAQRQVPGTLTTYSSTAGRAYSADRWGITNENASVQYQRIDTMVANENNLLNRYYGTFQKITSTGKMEVSVAIEGSHGFHLRGRQARVQLKMKASSAKTMRVALLQLTAAGTVDTIPATFISAHGANNVDPTFGTNISKIAPDANSADNASIVNSAVSCSVTTAWQRFGFTATLPTDFKNLILIIFTDSQFANGDTFSMSEVGVYDGVEIRDWVVGDLPTQLFRCQRYYAKSFSVDTAPAQSAGLTGAVRGHVSVAGATAGQPIGFRWPVQLRTTTPTLTFFNPSAANAFVRNTTAGTDATATAGANTGDLGTDITFTGIAAWTVAQSVAVHFTADAEL